MSLRLSPFLIDQKADQRRKKATFQSAIGHCLASNIVGCPNLVVLSGKQRFYCDGHTIDSWWNLARCLMKEKMLKKNGNFLNFSPNSKLLFEFVFFFNVFQLADYKSST